MAVKIFFILLMAVFFCLSPGFPIKAQRYAQLQAGDSDVAEQLTKIEDKIEKMSLGNSEILKKLDLILNNQAQIKEELNTIKVRSTHR